MCLLCIQYLYTKTQIIDFFVTKSQRHSLNINNSIITFNHKTLHKTPCEIDWNQPAPTHLTHRIILHLLHLKIPKYPIPRHRRQNGNG